MRKAWKKIRNEARKIIIEFFCFIFCEILFKYNHGLLLHSLNEYSVKPSFFLKPFIHNYGALVTLALRMARKIAIVA